MHIIININSNYHKAWNILCMIIITPNRRQTFYYLVIELNPNGMVYSSYLFGAEYWHLNFRITNMH